MEKTYLSPVTGRLSQILRRQMGLSSGLVNRLKWQNRLLVNGTPRHTDYQVQIGDTVTVLLDEPTPDYPAQQGPLTVLYEDDCFLAVDKPAGMLIHPSTHVQTGTLANFVLGYYEKTGQRAAFHPITRLDRDTFGVVLLAKNSHIHARMQKTPLQKIYRALVFGSPHEDTVITAPIARKPLPSLLREVRPDGKPCETRLHRLWQQGDTAFVELQPITGRTHQLRVHCAYEGYPIVGDPQYGTEATVARSLAAGYTYQQLCAAQITFTHPETGAAVTVASRLCPGQGKLIEGLR